MANSLADALERIHPNWLMYYVYIMRRPTGEPFYVGKGRRDRIAMHERNARSGKDQTYRGRIVRDVMRAGLSVTYEIINFHEAEADAFAEERRLIAQYGRFDQGGILANHTDGGEGAANPSVQTIAKRVKKLRAVMRDPKQKAAAVAVLSLHRNSEARKRNAAEALRTPEYREAKSAEMLERWKTPGFRQKATAASKAAQDLVWKAKHAEGIARAFSDPVVRERRKEAFRSERVRETFRAAATTPEARARSSKSAKAQRAAQELARTRALAMAATLGATVDIPNHRSSVKAWSEFETRLFAGALL